MDGIEAGLRYELTELAARNMGEWNKLKGILADYLDDQGRWVEAITTRQSWRRTSSNCWKIKVDYFNVELRTKLFMSHNTNWLLHFPPKSIIVAGTPTHNEYNRSALWILSNYEEHIRKRPYYKTQDISIHPLGILALFLTKEELALAENKTSTAV